LNLKVHLKLFIVGFEDDELFSLGGLSDSSPS